MNIKNARKSFFNLLLVLLTFVYVDVKAQDINDFKSAFSNNNSVSFLENKGQIINTDGERADNVLFSTQAGNVDVYITTTGLTYLFAKTVMEENPTVVSGEKRKISDYRIKRPNIKSIEWHKIDVELKGSSIKKENIISEQPCTEDYNYYDAFNSDGLFGVKKYKKITIKSIYPNIDWVLYEQNGGIKYDFILHPGANPSLINLVYKGANDLKKVVTPEGEKIKVETNLGNVEEGVLYSYDLENKNKIESQYEITEIGKNEYEVKIRVEDYNNKRTCVIDPALVWATFYGGDFWENFDKIHVDDVTGNVFVIGGSGSLNFPTMNPGGGAWYDPFNNGVNGNNNGSNFYFTIYKSIILKFNSSRQLIWATYYGGYMGATWYGNPMFTDIVTDAAGDLFISGYEGDGFQTQSMGGGSYYQSTCAGTGPAPYGDVILMKFSSGGVRQWATYFGGNGDDRANAMKFDHSGNLYIVGTTASTNFPVKSWGSAYYQGTKPCPIPGYANSFIARFNPAGSLEWCTYYGGGEEEYAMDVDVDCYDNIYVVGTTSSGFMYMPHTPTQNPGNGAYFQPANAGIVNTFILKFNSSGVRKWATLYGGGNSDEATACCTDRAGNFYVVGVTMSDNLPLKNPGNGAYFQGTKTTGWADADGYIAKFNSLGVMQWSTYFQGNYYDFPVDVKTDRSGDMYLLVKTGSSNLIVKNNPGSYFQGTYGFTGTSPVTGAGEDIFISKFNTQCNQVWGTYYGVQTLEEPRSMSVEKSGRIFITGLWGSRYNSAAIGFPGNVSNTFVNPGGGAFIQMSLSGYNPAHGSGGTSDGFIMEFVGTLSGPQAITVPTFTASPICFGDPTQFKISDTTGIINVSWNFGSSTSAQNTSTLLSPVHIYNSPGTYSVTVIIQYPCERDTVVQTVDILHPTVDVGPDLAVCAGNGIQLSATVSNGRNITYSWSPSVGLTNSNIHNPVAAPGSTSAYVLTITDGDGCVDTDSLVVTVNALPDVTVSNDTVICIHANALLSANVQGFGNITYTWTPSASLNTPGSNITTASPLVTTTYVVTVVDGNSCSDSDAVVVNVQTLPSIAAGTSATICEGQAAQLTATGGVNYQWAPSSTLTNPNNNSTSATPNTTTTYSLTVTDANGCSDTTSVTITVLPVPIADAGADATICSGSSVQLSGNGGGSYSWSPIANLNPVNVANPVVSPTGTTKYFLTVSNGICSAIDSVNITVNALPLVEFMADQTEGCPILCVNFTNTTANVLNSTWTFGDGNTSNANNTANCYSNSGTYSVTLLVTDNNGCTNTLSKTNYITVYPKPAAAFSSNPTSPTIADPLVYFIDQSSGATAWQWSFGDVNNSFSSDQNTQFTYADIGTYNVRLIVSNNYGCTDTAIDAVTVAEDKLFFIPNTFTPNSDNKNEIFVPTVVGVDIERSEMWIYDRWGSLIYSTKNLNEGWDGKANGGTDIAQQDTYVWKIRAKYIDGSLKQYVGHVNLIR